MKARKAMIITAETSEELNQLYCPLRNGECHGIGCALLQKVSSNPDVFTCGISRLCDTMPIVPQAIKTLSATVNELSEWI